MEQLYIPQKDYKVLVRCFTYNQAKYIEDALNGFAMQKTDFPFVCLVMDDASTDGEQEVIKAWMERECDMLRAENVEIEKSFVTIVPHKTNSSCMFAFYFLKENLYNKGGKMPMIAPWREHCEYEALCEGDDYWIDLHKLNCQIHYMDTNKNCSLCTHNAIVSNEISHNPYMIFNDLNSEQDLQLEQIVNRWIIPTASIIYRLSVLDDYPVWANQIYSGDQTLALVSFYRGHIHYLHRIMSVYRKNNGGVSIRVKSEKPNGFEVSEHLKLYEYFNDYSHGKYDDFLSSHIKKLKMINKYAQDRNQSAIRGYFLNPQYVLCRFLSMICKNKFI